MTGMVSTMRVNEARMEQAVNSTYLLATDIADYLVAKGLPFREAYGIVSRMSSFAYTENKRFNELNLDTYRQFSPLFDESVYQITAERSVAARNVQGGTSFKRVEEAIAAARSELEREVTPSATPI
jgi:argininosuccinate lyase